MKIIFHGENAAAFSHGFAEIIGSGAQIYVFGNSLADETERADYASAEVIIGTAFNASLPRPQKLKLFHAPAAGYDAIDVSLLPPAAIVCNCFGHEQAIAEYVMCALLARQIPLADADARLRRGDWAWWAGAPERVHGEIAEKTIGLLGFGHIGKTIAARAKAFDMRVHAANRTPVPISQIVDQAYTLDQIVDFSGSVDFLVVSLPLNESTKGIVNASVLNAMRRDAVIVNVGRGPVIDEAALYDALHKKRIGGAVIDTWYQYPSPDNASPLPSQLPFHELPNLLMTPHMSGWTAGTVRRRQRVIADNITRCMNGQPCINIVRAGRPG